MKLSPAQERLLSAMRPGPWKAWRNGNRIWVVGYDVCQTKTALSLARRGLIVPVPLVDGSAQAWKLKGSVDFWP